MAGSHSKLYPAQPLLSACRAIGEYAVEAGRVGEAGALVSGFLGALEKFDFALFEAVRFDRPVADDGRPLLDCAVAALDRCAAHKGARHPRL